MSLESVFRLSLIMNMVDNLTGPMARVQTSVGGSITKLQGLEQTMGNMTKTGAAMAGIGAQITDAAMSPVEATFATKKALGELATLGVKNLNALETAASDFSNQWAGTSKADFITAAYDIKSGIASLTDEGVAGYTELAGVTSKATKSNIAEMTSLFASGYGIYKNFYSDLSDIQFGEMFSAGIAQSVKTFKTTGSGMSEAIQTLGASATTSNVPLEEQLSILGMLQATMSGSEAGTKYKAFLRSAVQGGKELGLSFVDANNQMLSMPEILTKLKGKFGETMDAAEKVKLQQAFGDTEAVSLIDLMYSKTGDLQGNILNLYDSLGQGASVATDMANAINNTDPDQYQVLQQQIKNVTEKIGNNMLPTYNKMLNKSLDILKRISEWVDKNQKLASAIMLVIMAIGIFLTVGGTAIAVFGGIGLVVTKTIGIINGFRASIGLLRGLLDTIYIKALYAGDGLKRGFSTVRTFASSAVTGIKSVAINIASMAKTAAINAVNGLKSMAIGLANMAKQAIMTAVKALPGLIASVWSFTAALLANPITWIVIGIIALIAVIILLWKNWDSVVAWIQGAWNGFVNGIKAGFNWIRNLFSGMPGWLQIALVAFMPFIGIPMLIINNWDKIVAFFSGLWTKISDGFKTGIDNIKNFFTGLPEWFRKSGAKIIATLVEGILSAASKPVDAVKGIFKKVRELLPFSDAHEGPLSQLTLSGHRTMSTIAQGIEKGEDLPYKAVEKGFGKIETSGRSPIKKVNLKEVRSEKETTETTKESGSKSFNIEKLQLNIDLNKIKDLPKLFKLLTEIEDYINSNGVVVEGEA